MRSRRGSKVILALSEDETSHGRFQPHLVSQKASLYWMKSPNLFVEVLPGLIFVADFLILPNFLSSFKSR